MMLPETGEVVAQSRRPRRPGQRWPALPLAGEALAGRGSTHPAGALLPGLAADAEDFLAMTEEAPDRRDVLTMPEDPGKPGFDVLNGKIGRRTHYIHRAMAAAEPYSRSSGCATSASAVDQSSSSGCRGSVMWATVR